MLNSPDAKHGAELSGMAQSVGYLIAAIGPVPVFFGFLYSTTESWTLPLLLLIINCVILFIIGIGAGQNTNVQEK